MSRLTLVDLGCGYGSGAELAFRTCQQLQAHLHKVEFGRYVAVDNSSELLESAIRRAAALGVDAEGFCFDLDTREGTRPPAGIGDIVLVAFVLTHLAGAVSGLSEAGRLVNERGVILVVDAAYCTMTASGDDALVVTVAEIRRRLRHRDFDNLDTIARRVGLRRLSGMNDVEQRFGPGELSPKFAALAFVAGFDPRDPARVAWEAIRGGTLTLTHIRRAYVVDGNRSGDSIREVLLDHSMKVQGI
jgi:SAM-dependent methyltransferase